MPKFAINYNSTSIVNSIWKGVKAKLCIEYTQKVVTGELKEKLGPI